MRWRHAVRRAGRERMQRDRQHARLLGAFAIERVEGIDDVLAEYAMPACPGGRSGRDR